MKFLKRTTTCEDGKSFFFDDAKWKGRLIAQAGRFRLSSWQHLLECQERLATLSCDFELVMIVLKSPIQTTVPLPC